MKLRPAQEEVLAYRSGRLAVSAVPGSGKTFTLSLLAAQLISSGRINPSEGQQILIVTYLNASVEHFKAQIRRWLQEMGTPILGFEVRTLHSLGLEIVRTAAGGSDPDSELAVLDEAQSNSYLQSAVNSWIDAHPSLWHSFLPDDSVNVRARWREITERMARVFIRTAKNDRYRPDSIQAQLNSLPADGGESFALLWMLNGIYARYEAILTRQAALDFDDLILGAVELMENRLDLAAAMRQRWPIVLEDEAQDSVPLQTDLLGALSGAPGGNWIRVGDPNQAITSSFTAAHPRYFNSFIDRADVQALPLPNSGRSAPLIYEAANRLQAWVCEQHPVPEVRDYAFRRQDILPTPAGDAQPNPPNAEAGLRVRVYGHREEEELPDVGRLAHLYTLKYPRRTAAILVPTNSVGHRLAETLDLREAPYDNLLRGGGREREIAAVLHGLLALLANPLDMRALANSHLALYELEHPVAGVFSVDGSSEGEETVSGQSGRSPELERFQALLRSVRLAEDLLFPGDEGAFAGALPAGVATREEIELLQRFLDFVRLIFELRPLPIDDLVLALADELFAYGLASDAEIAGSPGEEDMLSIRESDLSIAYGIAAILRRWRDLHPEWRLPELVASLDEIASGRRTLPLATPDELGYEPQAGRITLATQHGAKGLEWDAVFLVGIDGFWTPGDLEAHFLGAHDFLGGDPTAEAVAQLRYLMSGDAGLFPGRTATESAHIELICERLRLLYVGVTRARRFLQVSRSRYTRPYNRNRAAEPTAALSVLSG